VSGLADAMRTATHDAHRGAERALLARCFVGGSTNKHAYLQLLTDLHVIYAALESAITNARDARVRQIWVPELARTASLRQDLVALEAAATPSKSAHTYAGHLEIIAAQAPHTLVAHMYTRYLGDLAGGQILRKLVRRGLGLVDQGLAFYDFGDVATTNALKVSFRRSIDELVVTPGEAAQLRQEAVTAFELNHAVFIALPRASWPRVASNMLRALW
jgi:heme oxygenase (biliverdin-producing, ferredoxin)